MLFRSEAEGHATGAQLIFCSEPLQVSGRGAKRADILSALNQLKIQGRNTTEELFVFFSGHGFAFIDKPGSRADIIIASDTAKFGQPEITLGTIPGIGGTQRLTRATGKSKAMDLCLTGRMMDAAEAERSGLVSRVVPADQLMGEVMTAAEKIASMSHPAAAMAKEAVNRAFETPLSEGLSVERNLFHATFALEDRSEGMAAFIEKRKPVNRNR